MTGTYARVAMRAAAIAIAIAALVDPVWSSNRANPPQFVAIDLSAGGSGAIERLKANAGGWEVLTREAAGPALPCAPDDRCVIVADGSRDIEVPADLARPLSVLALRPPPGPNISVRSALASASHAAAAGSTRVEIARTGTVAATEVRILDGGAAVGSATHTWRAETTAVLEIPWWPLGTGARRLRIEATAVDGETTRADNAIDLGVEVAGARIPVLVFDARPSWISTFVRRALDDDPRFTVGHRARIAPALSIGTPHTRLDSADLDEARLAIVGGPDALTATEVELLDRFVRVRGGTLVLLPEQRPAGPAARLFPGEWSEHLTQAPERLGAVYASEILRVSDLPVSTVLAQSGGRPAIVMVPSDNGRIVISGAMDAWRYRERDANAFDRFWRSVGAEGAAAGAGLSIAFDTDLASRSAGVRFSLRDRRMAPASSAEVSAAVSCGDRPASAVRLWPAGTLGEFWGEFASAIDGACRIQARSGDRQTHAGIAIVDRAQHAVGATLTKLERSARASGGVVMNGGDESQLVRALDAQRQPTSQVVSIRPMRAPWWIMPFAGCLTVEWWLRRRSGLR